MVQPDMGAHRRRLRRFRVEEALSLEIDGSLRQRSRDALLGTLAAALTRQEGRGSFETLSDPALDTAISIALALVDESAQDRLTVLITCAELLVADGQFARVRHLSSNLHNVADLVKADRPVLAAEIRATASLIAGEAEQALSSLELVLGTNGSAARPVSDNLSDIVGAGVLFAWLREWTDPAHDVSDKSVFEDIAGAGLEYARRSGDGLLLARVSFYVSYGRAARAASLVKVLRDSEDLQDPVFADYIGGRSIRTLFVPQIRAIEQGALKSESKLVALPTSSGKTLLAELRIAAALVSAPGKRALYIAPYRLLARQVERDLAAGLRFLNIDVADLGGAFDTSVDVAATNDVSEVARVLVLTPERLDAMMRASTAQYAADGSVSDILQSVELLVFDEVQLVGRQGRGAKFEFILARFRQAYPGVKILGLAASTYSVKNLGAWLGDASPIMGGRRPAGTLEILWQADGTLVQRSGASASQVAHMKRGKSAIDDAVRLALQLADHQKPVLVVEPQRSYCESFAAKLEGSAPNEGVGWRESLRGRRLARLDTAAQEVRATLGEDHPLARWILSGIAYHHAGVPSNLLRLIEQLARERLLRFLVSTTTVAEGADLPFRTIIIPHQTFSGSSGRKLDRDLYLNMIGRAGRASYAVEGLVVTLQSSSSTLRDLVRTTLWSDRAPQEVVSALAAFPQIADNADDYSDYRNLQSQVLAWVSEGTPATYESAPGETAEVRDPTQQVRAIVDRLYVGTSSTGLRQRTRQLVSGMLSDLAQEGLVRAASPYAATAIGRQVGLTGLSYVSVRRMVKRLSDKRDAWLLDLAGSYELNLRAARLLARLALETEEVLSESLWLRRTSSSPAEKFEYLRSLGDESFELPDGDPNLQADVNLLSSWILGTSFPQMATLAPIYPKGLFAGSSASERASDAADYAGRIAYTSSWALSALRHLTPAVPPKWLGEAVELGVNSETAVYVMRQFGLGRSAAVAIASIVGPKWAEARDGLLDVPPEELVLAGLAAVDVRRLRADW